MLDLEPKSEIAMKIDRNLQAWKANLPQWLNPNHVSLKEPEWMSKQRLALNIRKHAW